MSYFAPYTDQNFAVKFFGTGSLNTETPTVGFFWSDSQKDLFVFDYDEAYDEKLKSMITVNLRRIVFYTSATRVAPTLGLERILDFLRKDFPDVKIELYVSITSTTLSDPLTGYNLNKKRFLKLLYTNPNLKIVVTGYYAWEKLRKDIDATNIAISDGPRVFLAEEF
ncbi:hypothetical protein IJH29_00730 [Candidatus Saccharibacteria bacterium]|nr:hypothetical protein [Candidatus Saccharibacteria bacterium]